ncbi:UNVERIFIED_CONTAM: hypothetical protein Sindi_1314500 [Sesamum indicum]
MESGTETFQHNNGKFSAVPCSESSNAERQRGLRAAMNKAGKEKETECERRQRGLRAAMNEVGKEKETECERVLCLSSSSTSSPRLSSSSSSIHYFRARTRARFLELDFVPEIAEE